MGHISTRTQSQSRREAISTQQIQPIRVTFEFPHTVTHHFTDESPCKQISLVLKIQNLLQSDTVCQFSCEVVASQSWKKGKGRYSIVDVSEGESFLWVGKTSHKLKNFKLNVSEPLIITWKTWILTLLSCVYTIIKRKRKR